VSIVIKQFIEHREKERRLNSHPTLLLVGVSVCDIVTIVPRISNPGDIVYLDKGISISLGGHPCNIAIDLAKLGYNPRNIFVVSAIGDDFCGNFIEKQLSEYNIQLMLYRVEDVGSNKNLILVVEGEDRRFHVEVGASSRLPLAHVIKALNEVKPKLLHIAPGVLGEIDENLGHILRIAQSMDTITFVDVGAAKPFGKKGWDFLTEALEYTDIFHCNVYELRKLFNLDNVIEGIKKILEKGVKIVLVTDGDKGAYVAKKNTVIHQQTFKVNAVDPTGAGDAFQAGFIYSISTLIRDKLSKETLEELDLETLAKLLLYAQAVGALCVTKPGTTTAISKNGVNDLLINQGEKILKNSIYIKL